MYIQSHLYITSKINIATVLRKRSLKNVAYEEVIAILDKLNVGHWCIVAPPRKSSNNPRVPSIPLPIPILHLREQRMDNLLLVDESQRLPSLMKRPVLRQRNHFVHKLPHRARPRPRSLNPTMFKQLCCEATEQGFSLISRPVEIWHMFSMPHCIESAPIVDCYTKKVLLIASGFGAEDGENGGEAGVRAEYVVVLSSGGQRRRRRREMEASGGGRREG